MPSLEVPENWDDYILKKTLPSSNSSIWDLDALQARDNIKYTDFGQESENSTSIKLVAKLEPPIRVF